MNIYERIKALRISKGMSQQELASKVGYEGRSAISKVENGERDISQSMITKYAAALDVTPTYLLYGDSPLPAPNLYRIERKKIPLLGNIACGEPIFASEEHDVFFESDSDLQADFCLKAKGDSMIGARIHDGDIVFIRKQDMVEDGEIAAVLIDDEATLKRVHFDREAGILSLFAENPKYKTMRFSGEALNSIKILGKAVAFQSHVF